MSKVQCDNCGWRGDEDDMGKPLLEVEHLAERLNPGSVVPYGECPECECFCYAAEEVPI